MHSVNHHPVEHKQVRHFSRDTIAYFGLTDWQGPIWETSRAQTLRFGMSQMLEGHVPNDGSAIGMLCILQFKHIQIPLLHLQ
jgi:hypothetical protein